MNLNKALERVDEGQHDCFWHDHTLDLNYLLILPGAAANLSTEVSAVVMSQAEGRVTASSREYEHLCSQEPGLLPGVDGPLTVLMIL